MFKPGDLFDLSQTEHAALFEGCEHAWDALKKLKAYIDAHAKPTPHSHERARVFIGDQVTIGEGTSLKTAR